MGASHGVFSEKKLEQYQNDHGHLSVSEIKRAFQRFAALHEEEKNANLESKITKESFQKIPELIVNPFADRIWQIFSNKGAEEMDYDHFLTMVSVFSLTAPVDIKAESAFRIYDFDGDDYLSRDDIRQILLRQTLRRLDEGSISEICDQMFSDLGLEGDENITKNDFIHIVSNAPDFYSTFCISF